jgi:hypothetical protein
MKTQRHGTPLFVVAGSCPNRFCGMQAMLYCQLESDIQFWWVKPAASDPARLEVNTLNKHHDGPFKNVAEKSQKLYVPLAEKFQGSTDGNFTFYVDAAGRAIIEEVHGDGKSLMFVYLIWQESWSSALARRAFIQGKICYEKGLSSETPEFYCRQYRIEDGCMRIESVEEEEIVTMLLPGEDFQQMHVMDFLPSRG